MLFIKPLRAFAVQFAVDVVLENRRGRRRAQQVTSEAGLEVLSLLLQLRAERLGALRVSGLET